MICILAIMRLAALAYNPPDPSNWPATDSKTHSQTGARPARWLYRIAHRHGVTHSLSASSPLATAPRHVVVAPQLPSQVSGDLDLFQFYLVGRGGLLHCICRCFGTIVLLPLHCPLATVGSPHVVPGRCKVGLHSTEPKLWVHPLPRDVHQIHWVPIIGVTT